MNRRRSIAEARDHLPHVVREAEAGATVEITRHGKPVAVRIGRRDYDRLTSSRRPFGEAYEEFVRAVDLRDLGIDPGPVSRPSRYGSPGRDVPL